MKAGNMERGKLALHEEQFQNENTSFAFEMVINKKEKITRDCFKILNTEHGIQLLAFQTWIQTTTITTQREEEHAVLTATTFSNSNNANWTSKHMRDTTQHNTHCKVNMENTNWLAKNWKQTLKQQHIRKKEKQTACTLNVDYEMFNVESQTRDRQRTPQIYTQQGICI